MPDDNAERKRLDKILNFCRERLDPIVKGILTGSPIPQFVIDRDHKVISWNTALEKYSGIKAEDIIGTDGQWKAFYKNKRPCMADLLVDGAISEIPRWYDGNYSRSELVEGAYAATGIFPELGEGGKWLYFTAAVIRDEEGAIIGAVETLEDITDRKRAEEQLQEAKRQAEMYLELMGHDINNMNQIGIGYLELALSSPGLDEAVKHKIEKALESLDNSSRLIGNVQKLQRIPEMTLERVDAGKMLGEVCAQFVGAPGKAVTINCAARPGCHVMANVLLRDVFMNIIGNAIKHSTGPLTINVSMDKVTKEGRDFYKVSIEDNGPGISPELKERLFTRFQRGTTHAPGKGLGLYLVKSLVDSYHGTVWAEDRVSGDYKKGSRFVIMLPAMN